MKVQSMMESMGKYACLAFCYVKATLPKGLGDFEEKCMLVSSVMSLIEAGIITEDCYVKSAVQLLDYVDPAYDHDVTKKDITSLTELKDVPSAAVRFDNNGYSHYVYAENGLITFDSLDNSQCRKYGKPTTCRIITRKEKKNENKNND